jgi:ABC-type lipoprotein release transport system permease subunit
MRELMGSIEKQRNIVDFTLSSLWRRKGKNGALLAVYSLVVFFLASVMFFTQGLKKEAAAVLADAPELVVQRLVAGRHDLVPSGYIEKVRDIRGVRGVRGRLWGYYYDPHFLANYTLVVPEEFNWGRGKAVVGRGVARRTMTAEGSTLTFIAFDGKPLSLTIANVMPAASELVAADLILLSADDFRMLFGVPPGVATDLVVEVANPAEVPTVARKIGASLPDTRPISRDEILRTYDAVFSWRSGILLTVLSGALLAFVIFAWDKATGLSAEERKEIGILKAVGWDTGDVLLMKFWEGIAVSLSAFLIGAVLAYFHIFAGSAPLFEPVLKGWSVLYPEFRLTPDLDSSLLAVLFFLTVVPYTVATIVPAWRAATVDPDEVMRG